MSRRLMRTLGVAALVVGVGKMMRRHAWKRAGGASGDWPAKGWHDAHGPQHPFFAHWKRMHGERAGCAEAEADAAAPADLI